MHHRKERRERCRLGTPLSLPLSLSLSLSPSLPPSILSLPLVENLSIASESAGNALFFEDCRGENEGEDSRIFTALFYDCSLRRRDAAASNVRVTRAHSAQTERNDPKSRLFLFHSRLILRTMKKKSEKRAISSFILQPSTGHPPQLSSVRSPFLPSFPSFHRSFSALPIRYLA